MIDNALMEASRYPKPCSNTPPSGSLATWSGKTIPGLCDAMNSHGYKETICDMDNDKTDQTVF
jgi:hypothetical protein